MKDAEKMNEMLYEKAEDEYIAFIECLKKLSPVKIIDYASHFFNISLCFMLISFYHSCEIKNKLQIKAFVTFHQIVM